MKRHSNGDNEAQVGVLKLRRFQLATTSCSPGAGGHTKNKPSDYLIKQSHVKVLGLSATRRSGRGNENASSRQGSLESIPDRPTSANHLIFGAPSAAMESNGLLSMLEPMTAMPAPAETAEAVLSFLDMPATPDDTPLALAPNGLLGLLEPLESSSSGLESHSSLKDTDGPISSATTSQSAASGSRKSTFEAVLGDGRSVFLRRRTRHRSAAADQPAIANTDAPGSAHLLDTPVWKLREAYRLEADERLAHRLAKDESRLEPHLSQAVDGKGKGREQMWVDKYRPTRFTELLGEEVRSSRGGCRPMLNSPLPVALPPRRSGLAQRVGSLRVQRAPTSDRQPQTSIRKWRRRECAIRPHRPSWPTEGPHFASFGAARIGQDDARARGGSARRV